MTGKTCKGFTHHHLLVKNKKRLSGIASGFRKNRSGAGFTLVEMLIVVLLFSVVMGTTTSVFTSALKLQKYNLSQQQLLNQTSYVIEYMGRAIRMAKTGGCVVNNYESTSSSLKFGTYNDHCWRFYLEEGRLKIDKDAETYFLTSDDFTVNDFEVTVSGDVSGSQPKVTIYFDIEGEVPGKENPRIKIQTTISQRNLNL